MAEPSAFKSHVMPEPWSQLHVKTMSVPTPAITPAGTELSSVRPSIGKPVNVKLIVILLPVGMFA